MGSGEPSSTMITSYLSAGRVCSASWPRSLTTGSGRPYVGTITLRSMAPPHRRRDARGKGAGGNVREHDRIGGDHGAASDMDGTENASTDADRDVVLDHRISVVSRRSDRVVPVEADAVADAGVAADDGSDGMHEPDSVPEPDLGADLGAVDRGLHETKRVVHEG